MGYLRNGPAVRRLALTAAAFVALLAAPATAGAQLSQLYGTPGISPPGANDFSCRPSAERPTPVILVHGTFGDMTVSWNLISPVLVQDGHCVFALDLVRRGSGPVEESAAKLADFVDRVLEATGAQKVSLVGHSQGGMLGRYYVKMLGGAGKVEDAVGLAPSHHGTDTPLAPGAAQYGDCPACGQQVAGSELMRALNSGEDAPGAVDYTVISTRYDWVVTPYTSQALRGGANVTNVVLQDLCPLDLAEHVDMIYDHVALQWVRSALSRSGPADPALRPDCFGLGDAHPPEGAQPPPGGQAEAAAPRRLRIASRRIAVSRSGRGRLVLACRAPADQACGGRFDMSVNSRRVAAGGYRVAGGRRAAVRFQLTRRGRATLRRRGAVDARVRAVFSDERRAVRLTTRRVRLVYRP